MNTNFFTPEQIEKLSDKELHEQAKKYGKISRMAQREFAAFLPEICKRKLYLDHKFITISHYAAVIGGLTKETVGKVLTLHEKLQDKPILWALMVEQGWSKLSVISNVAKAETQEFWKEKVETMSKSTLETFIREIKKEDLRAEMEVGEQQFEITNEVANDAKQFEIDFGNPEISAAESQESPIEKFSPGGESQTRNNMSFKVTIDVEKQLRLFKYKLEKERKQPLDWNEIMKEFLKIAMQAQEHVCVVASQKVTTRKAARAEKTAPTLEEIQKSLPEKTTRPMPKKVKNYLVTTYKEMCGYPGCKHPANIDHHTRRFKLIPNHDPQFIVSLCKNHERLAHLGLINNEECDPELWKLRLTADKNEPKFQIDQIVNGFRMETPKIC